MLYTPSRYARIGIKIISELLSTSKDFSVAINVRGVNHRVNAVVHNVTTTHTVTTRRSSSHFNFLVLRDSSDGCLVPLTQSLAIGYVVIVATAGLHGHLFCS